MSTGSRGKVSAETERLRKALLECVEVLELSEPGPGDAIVAPEDPEVLALCKRHGFGAVMASAARQWARTESFGGLPVYGDISAHTVGACRGTVRQALAMARKALKP